MCGDASRRELPAEDLDFDLAWGIDASGASGHGITNLTGEPAQVDISHVNLVGASWRLQGMGQLGAFSENPSDYIGVDVDGIGGLVLDPRDDHELMLGG